MKTFRLLSLIGLSLILSRGHDNARPSASEAPALPLNRIVSSSSLPLVEACVIIAGAVVFARNSKMRMRLSCSMKRSFDRG